MNKLIEILMQRDGMSEEAATEYLQDELRGSGLEDGCYLGLEEFLRCELGLEPDYVMDLFDFIQENPNV